MTTTAEPRAGAVLPAYITTDQASAALAARSWSVFELVEVGELRAIRVGSQVLVSAYDVAQLGGVIA